MKLSNARLALSLAAVAAGMLMLAYASVPLYRLFCETTGFGGTTRRAAASPTQISRRIITVHFNADTASDLPWDFQPEVPSVTVHVGESKLAHYRVRNRSGHSTTGHATYNVLPEKAGAYFNKIECFCFQDQPLAAGQKASMPVSFFLDPALLADPDMADVHTITLSYTFFPSTSGTK